MKFYGGVRGGKRNKWLDFGSNQDHYADYPFRNLAITRQIMSRFLWNFQDSSAVIQGTIYLMVGVICITMLTLQIGNLDNMRVMTCVGQGGLCSLSALVQLCYCKRVVLFQVRISAEGINVTVCGMKAATEEYIDAVRKHPLFEDMIPEDFKVSY